MQNPKAAISSGWVIHLYIYPAWTAYFVLSNQLQKGRIIMEIRHVKDT